MSCRGSPGTDDYVGQIAGLQGADLPIPPEQLGPIQQVRLLDGQRRHAVCQHRHKLARLSAMRNRPYVGANGHGSARGDLLFEFLDVLSRVSDVRAPRQNIRKMVKVGTAKICFSFIKRMGLVAQLIGMVE
jgi:hypothetical protein